MKIDQKMIELVKNVAKLGTPKTAWIGDEVAIQHNYDLAVSILADLNKPKKDKNNVFTMTRSGEIVKTIYNPVFVIVNGDKTKAVKAMDSFCGVHSTCDFGDIKMKIWKMSAWAEKALRHIRELWDKENYHIEVIVDPNNPDSYEVVEG